MYTYTRRKRSGKEYEIGDLSSRIESYIKSLART